MGRRPPPPGPAKRGRAFHPLLHRRVRPPGSGPTGAFFGGESSSPSSLVPSLNANYVCIIGFSHLNEELVKLFFPLFSPAAKFS